MNWRETRAVHALIGNDAPEVQTGFTRGIVATGLASIANTILILLPIDAEATVQLMAAMNGALIMGSFLLFGFLDRWMKRNGWKP